MWGVYIAKGWNKHEGQAISSYMKAEREGSSRKNNDHGMKEGASLDEAGFTGFQPESKWSCS